MAAGRGYCIIWTVWEPSVMAAGSSPVWPSMPRSSPLSVFPGGANGEASMPGRWRGRASMPGRNVAR